MAPVNPIASWKNPAYRLLRRISYGQTLAEAGQAAKLGPAAYLEAQLNYTAIDDSVSENAVAKYFPRLSLTPLQLSKVDGWVSRNQLVDATLYRMIHSKRQLYEKMVEFWRDHFNVYYDKCGTEMILPWDRNVIRKYAMTDFYSLLLVGAKNACMMRFLDNETSSSSNPNQNYARELMELHTLGVDGGYTQKDVEEVARCFTGWGINYDNTHITYLTFAFDPSSHDDGPKKVLGLSIPAGGGIHDGEKVLHYLAYHPNTAKHICRKLIVYFMGTEPGPVYLNQVASVYLKSQGDIRTVLRAIFSVDLMGTPAKLKRPAHLIVSAIRALNPPQFSLNSLAEIRDWYLSITNQIPYYWAPPNGYPDATGYWAGNMLERWNFGFDLANNTTSSIRYDSTKLIQLFTPQPFQAAPVASALNKLFCLGEMSGPELADIQTQYLAKGAISGERLNGAFALALNSPSFQYF